MPIRRVRRSLYAALAAAVILAAGLMAVPASQAATPPHVTVLSVRTGGIRGGTRVVVRGSGLSGARKVLFGTVRGTHLEVLGPHRVVVRSPAHAAGTVHVRVVTGHGTSARTLADRFTYVPPPKVTTSGTLHAGQAVSLHGGPFRSVRKVTIAGTSVPFTVVDTTLITATVPPLPAAQQVPIQVTDAYGLSPVYYAFAPHPARVQIATTSVAWNDVKLQLSVSTDPDSLPTAWDGIRLERTYYPHNGGMSSSTLLATLPPDATSYDDDTAQPNVTYRYSAVPTLDGASEVPFDNVELTTPAPPGAPYTLTSATATPRSSGAVVLRWNEPSTTYFGSVMIRRAVGGAAPATPTDGDLVTSSSSYTGPFLDTTASASTTYSYAFFPMSPSGAWATPTDATTTTPVAGAGWSDPVNESSVEPLDLVTCEAAAGICHAVYLGAERALMARGADGSWTRQAPWTTTTNQVPDELVCSGTSFCVVRTVDGQLVTEQDGVWTAPITIPTTTGRPPLSCAGPVFCLLASSEGAYRWDGSTWSLAPGSPTSVGALSCVAPSWCMVETGGQAYTYDGTTWTATDNGSMPTQGHVDGPPTGIDPGPISCTSPTYCMITSGNPDHAEYATWNGTTWTRTLDWGLRPTSDGVWSLSCGSAGACVLDSGYGQDGTLGFDGSTWSRYDFQTMSEYIAGTGCYAALQCLEITPTAEYRFTGGS